MSHLPYSKRNIEGRYASRFVCTNGDGTGSIEMNVDGSVTPVDFKITAGANQLLIIHRMLPHILDDGPLDAGYYGKNLILTNGIHLITEKFVDGVLTETVATYQYPIRKNVDWGAYCYDVQNIAFGGGVDSLLARYTLDKDGAPFALYPGESFIVRIADDLTQLVGQHARAGMVLVDV